MVRFKSLCVALFFLSQFFLIAETKVGGTISMDTVWDTLGSPYICTTTVTVKGKDGPDSVATLHINSGVKVRFRTNCELIIGSTSASQPGGLVADASGGNRIVFTSDKDTTNGSPDWGDWRCITLYRYAYDDSCILDSCDIKFAGYSNNAGIYCVDASPKIRKCVIDSSSKHGVRLIGNTSGDTCAPVIVGNTITRNGQYGIYCYQYGSYVCSPVIDSNTIAENDSFGIRVYANWVGKVTNNTFTNNSPNAIEVYGGTVKEDATWQDQGVPYIVYGTHINVYGTDGGDNVTTLRIDPGVEVQFPSNYGLNVATATTAGALFADASGGNRITFTRKGSSGNWRGIRFNNKAYDDSCMLDSCDVRFAGQYDAGIYCFNASATIRKCLIDSSAKEGIRVYGTAINDTCAPSIVGSTINNNATYGIWCRETGYGVCLPTVRNNDIIHDSIGIYIYDATPTIEHNNIDSCEDYGAYNYSYSTLVLKTLTENYWGDSLGPYHPITNPMGSGNEVGDSIKYEPWLISGYTSAFYIFDVTVSARTINPAEGDTLEITAKITETANWKVDFLDTAGVSQRQFSGSDSTINVLWDGTATGGDTLNDLHYYRISATTSSNDTAASVHGKIWVGPPIAEITFPSEYDTLRCDTIHVLGTASCLEFQEYELFYSVDSTPYSWTNIITSTDPVESDTLAVWDAYSDTNVTTGYYALKLEVTDDYSLVGVDTVFDIYIDIFRLDSIAYDSTAFTPEDDESLKISFRINHDANVTAKIYQGYNDTTNLKKTISLGDLSAGSHTFYWDGTDDTDGNVTWGDYRLQLTGQDIYAANRKYGSESSAEYTFGWQAGYDNCILRGTFNALRGGTSGNVAGFSSGVNGLKGPSRIGGRIWSGSYNPQGCFDTTGVVRAISISAQGRSFSYVWDGRDDSGNVVSSGEYFIKWDEVSEPLLPESTIIVGEYKPLADSVSVSPRLIIGNNEVVEVEFKLRWNSEVDVIVKKAAAVIDTLHSGSLSGGVTHKFEWEGKNSSGQYVSDTGEYTVVISTSAKGKSETERRSVHVYR